MKTPRRPFFTRRRAIFAVALVGLLATLLTPLPLKIAAEDEAAAAAHAIDSLLADRRVWTEHGLGALYDARFMKQKTQLYFENRAGLDNVIFTSRGLKQLPPGGGVALDRGGAVIRFSHETLEENRTAHLQFSYSYGSQGAQGYEVRTYKCLVGRYFVFAHRWVS